MKPGTIVYQGKTKKGNDIIIRYPLKSDVHAMLEFINTLSEEQTFIMFQGIKITLKEQTIYVRSWMDKIKTGRGLKLLVLCNTRLIGSTDIELKENAEKHVGSLGIAISKDFRSEGVGSLLLKLIHDEAKKHLHDMKILTLGCFETNSIAHEMYRKFGFIDYGTLPKGILHKGTYIGHIFMYKQVS